MDQLYSFDSSGKIRYWNISVKNNGDYSQIITKFGIENGKEIINKRNITSGKNIGKTNETSHYSQALHEAKSKWNKKIDAGYKSSLNKKDTKSPLVILPMLAHDYTKRYRDIIFPCFVQAKLDGVRGIFINGKIQSRTGKFFKCLDHITNELENVKHVLDGELYSDSLNFQEIVGIVRKETLDENDKQKIKQIYFLVYDVVSDMDYIDRLSQILKKDVFKNKFKYTKLHNTDICKSRESVAGFHDLYISQGYEGLILRNFIGKYEVKSRSKNLQKLKTFMTEEFKIISFTTGTGIESGLVIWTCKTKEDKKFNVRPSGTHEERSKLFKIAKEFIGKNLTVKFFEYTNDGIPRFPVGIAIRDYE